MSRTKMVVFGFVALLLFPAGWWCRGLTVLSENHPVPAVQSSPTEESTLRQSKARTDKLETELMATHETMRRQREMLRLEALEPQQRSVEELFALLPAPFPAGDWSASETMYEDCWFMAADGIRLHGWYARQANPNAVILYLHGNAGNITHRSQVVSVLHDRLAASVLLFDYRGYGRSEGQPTINGMLRDARAARTYLADCEDVSGDQVILLGRSLGGAIAVQLAAEDGARGLVLESTFASLRDAAAVHYPKWGVDILVSDRLNSVNTIGKYTGPLLISHGSADRTVPYEQGLQLYQRANKPKSFVRIPNRDHNEPQTEEYYRELHAFVKALPR